MYDERAEPLLAAGAPADERGFRPPSRPGSPWIERASSAVETLHRRAVSTTPAVLRFVDGVVLYVLSREWHDLIATNIFLLHPLPYCDAPDSKLPCTREASSGAQLCFALAMLLGAVLVYLLLSGRTPFRPLSDRWPSLAILPPMFGMCVGWAWGLAAVQRLVELDDEWAVARAHPGLVNLALSAAATPAAALLALACRPSTLARGCCGVPRGTCAALHHNLDGAWRLCARALSVVVMMLWQRAAALILVEGAGVVEVRGPIYERMLLFWAVAITATGALASSHIVACSARSAAALAAADAPDAADGADGARARGGPLLCGMQPCRPSAWRESCSSAWQWCVRWWEASDGLAWWRLALAVQMLAFIEQTFGWVISCAWTDWVVASTSLGDFPTPTVALKDLGIALCLTALVVVWLLFATPHISEAAGRHVATPLAPMGAAARDDDATTERRSDDAESGPNGRPRTDAGGGSQATGPGRTELELLYLTNAFSFFAGWAWVAWLRDLSTLLAPPAALLSGTLSYAVEFATYVAFAPGLTYMLVWKWGPSSQYVAQREWPLPYESGSWMSSPPAENCEKHRLRSAARHDGGRGSGDESAG